MRKYWAYISSLLLHKWFVFFACLELKVPIHLAILHDISKFSPQELIAYTNYFFDKNGKRKDVSKTIGSYDPSAQVNTFQRAWLHHQNHNKHHWNYWIVMGDKGNINPLEIPEVYVREMIADWIGAGRAYNGKSDPIGWYENQKENLVFHPKTKELLERLLGEC